MRLILKVLLLLLFLFHFEISIAQLERSNWYFGPTSKGLYFSPTGVVSVTNNSFTPYTNEGCSVVSNPLTGALLFYTDGSRVIDMSHNIMPNGSGLNSLPSSAGTGRLIADPNNCNRFYLFHNTSVFENSSSTKILYYSVVEMSLPGNGTTSNPKGDVVSGMKNITITTGVAEGLEIIPVSKSHDYWILVPHNSNSSITVYKFSTGVITLASTYSLLSTLQDIRCITYSPVNNKIAVSSMIDYDNTLILNFNPLSGTISGEMIIPGLPAGTNGAYHGVYDLAWSPDATKLYISKYRQSSTGGKLFQYNLSNSTTTLIYNASATSNTLSARGLELGPDGKIYFLCANPDGTLTNIGAINNPNNPAASCGFNSAQINMGSDLGNAGKFPKFLLTNNRILNLNDTTISIIKPCGSSSDITTFSINKPAFDTDGDNINYVISSVAYPGASAVFSSANTIRYTNSAAMPFSDILTIKYCDNNCYSRCDSFQIILNINSSGVSTLTLPSQISSCTGLTKILDAGPGFASYLWSTGATTQTISVQNTGLYYVSATNFSGCQFSDSVNVTFYSPSINLGNDTTVCGNIILNITQPFASILWNNGSSAPIKNISSSGSYYVTVKDSNNCTAKDSINIIVDPDPDANFSAPTSTGISNPIVQYIDESSIALPGTIVNWQWNFGDSLSGTNNISSLQNPSHTFPLTGTYCAQLIVTSNKGCKDSVTNCIVIDPEFVFFIPNSFSPNGDGKNDDFFGKGESINKFEMMIFDRWGNMIFQTDDINKHWDGKANKGVAVVQQDVYVYVINLTDSKREKHNYIGSITVVR